MKTIAIAAATLSLAVLAGCDQPKDRGGTGRTDTTAAPAAPLDRTSEPLPAAPAWAAGYLGKGLRDAFPDTGECIGNTDAVSQRHVGASPGTTIVGWGWDTAAKAAVERIVLIDNEFVIVGWGETGLPRPDVPTARPEITSPTTGWRAATTLTAGPVDAYGITSGGKGVCKLGHLEF